MAIKAYSYAKDGSKALSKNFHVREFKCKDGSDPIFIDDELSGSTAKKSGITSARLVNINSAFRTASHNAKAEEGGQVQPATFMARRLTSGSLACQWTRWRPTSKHCFPAREALDDTTRTVLSTSMCGR